MPNIFEADALKNQHLHSLQVRVCGGWQLGELVPIVGEFASPYKIVDPPPPSYSHHPPAAPTLVVDWQDVIFSRHDPHINWDDSTITWTAAWPVSVNAPINSAVFSQGDYQPVYADWDPQYEIGSDVWTLTGMGLSNGVLTVGISLPNDHSSNTGSYTCHLTINGVEFTAKATIEFVLDVS
jgi:hypothetical protein